jgi:hypothetical protein
MVMSSPLAISSLICVYVCAIVMGGVWWVWLCMCCI